MKPTVMMISAVITIVPFLSTGCSSGHKTRIAMLEDTNRNLTRELNGARSALDGANRDLSELQLRLSGQSDEASQLRLLLADSEAREAAAPVGWTPVAGGGMISIPGNLLFSAGKIKLRSDSRATLDGIASTVQGEYGDKDILIFGHTDDQPIKKSGWEDNWQLSSERALAVVRHMAARGVVPARLVACGCGENRPRTANSSAGNRANNRRVEIFAIDPQPQTGRP